jgi:hypothetical protein
LNQKKTNVIFILCKGHLEAKAWRETFCVEDTWTFTARNSTQLVNPEFRLEWIVERGTQADEKLGGLAELKCAF